MEPIAARHLARRLAAGCAVAAMLAGGAVAASPLPRWVPVAAGETMQYFIDAATVRSQGELTYYRLHGRGVQSASRDTTVEAEVGVDCARQLRVAYITTVRWRDGVRTATGADPEPVRAGSRHAGELAVACQLAKESGADPTPQALAAAGGPGGIQLGAGPVAGMPAAGSRNSGTGFAISRRIVVTNLHVVRSCERVQVAQPDGIQPARVLASDARSDLAALEVAEGGLLPLELASQPSELGDAITVLGYPLAQVLGPDLRVSTGIVSGLSGVGGDRRVLQISAPVQPGNSGGPVLDGNGQVAAVVVTRMDLRMNAENVSFAVRTPVLRQFLAEHAITPDQPQGQRKPVPVAVGQAVKRAAPSVLLVQCA